MKKILSILAMALLVVACGSEEKKPLTVEEQAKAYAQRIYDLGSNNQTAEMNELVAEWSKWYSELSPEDKVKAAKATDEFNRQNGAK